MRSQKVDKRNSFSIQKKMSPRYFFANSCVLPTANYRRRHRIDCLSMCNEPPRSHPQAQQSRGILRSPADNGRATSEQNELDSLRVLLLTFLVPTARSFRKFKRLVTVSYVIQFDRPHWDTFREVRPRLNGDLRESVVRVFPHTRHSRPTVFIHPSVHRQCLSDRL